MRLPALACLGALLLAVPAYAQDAGEMTFWQSVKDSKNPAELQAYLQAYPHGTFATLARIRIKALGGNPGPAVQAPAAQTTPAAHPPSETPAVKTETPAAAEVQWQEFRSPEGGFSVLLPGEPKLAVNPPDANGHAEHRYSIEQGDSAFIVAYDDYAPGHVNPASASAVLPKAQDALLKAMGGTLRSEGPVTLDGLPGRQVTFATADHNIGRVRIYIGQNRLYQLWYLGPAGQESRPAVDRFFDSFKIGATTSTEAQPGGRPAPNRSAEPAPSAAPAPAAAENSWHEFSPPNGGFSILLPGEAKAEITPPKPNGRAESRYVVDQGDTAYVVAVDDYPPGHLTHANPRTLLDAAQNAVLKGLKGKLRDQRPVTISGYPGREILFDTPDHSTGKVRVFVVRNRLYQTWYLGPTGQETRPEVDRFLNSFRLTG